MVNDTKLRAYNFDLWSAVNWDRLPDNTVLISVNDEYGDLPQFKFPTNDGSVLHVRFADICCGRTRKQDGNLIKPISNPTAKNIVEYIAMNKDKNFLIHCHAGVSRSSAIAMYIHLKYGHSLKENYWLLSEPNKFLLGALFVEELRPTIKP